jgi:hypothetical protein
MLFEHHSNLGARPFSYPTGVLILPSIPATTVRVFFSSTFLAFPNFFAFIFVAIVVLRFLLQPFVDPSG